MPRIPYPDLSKLSDAKRAYASSGARQLNVVRMAMHTPDGLWERQRDLMGGSVTLATLSPVLREILILRVAHLSNSEYVLFHHLSIARNLGMSDGALKAIKTGDYTALPEKERVIAQLTSEVVLNVSPGDATLAAARAMFSDAEIFEMVALIANYMMTARIAAVGGCEPDSAAIAGWDRDKTLKG